MLHKDNMVKIHTFCYRQDADLARSALTAAGIESVIMSDDAGGQGLGIQFTRGVHLFVRPDDEDRAKQLLDIETA